LTGEGRESIYNFTYRADNETVEVMVERPSLIPISVRTVRSGDDIVIDSSTSVIKGKQLTSKGILVISFSELKYVLRGYPFDNVPDDIGIEFINTSNGEDQNDSNFSVTIRYKDIEEIAIDDTSIRCHKLEIRMSGSGIMRMLKPFIPKTYFWYSVEAPHYLVAYEGSSGMPGSPKSRIQIIDYSGWR
jgi:hypothetical protein